MPVTARSAPGLDSVSLLAGEVRNSWPSRKLANAVNSATTRAATPSTRTLAASTIGRRGAVARVARIVPVAYSLLMTRMPRMPSRSVPPRYAPVRLTSMGSNAALLPAGIVAQCARVTPVAMPLAARPTNTVMPRVHSVERTVRSFVHSLRTRSAVP